MNEYLIQMNDFLVGISRSFTGLLVIIIFINSLILMLVVVLVLERKSNKK